MLCRKNILGVPFLEVGQSPHRVLMVGRGPTKAIVPRPPSSALTRLHLGSGGVNGLAPLSLSMPRNRDTPFPFAMITLSSSRSAVFVSIQQRSEQRRLESR